MADVVRVRLFGLQGLRTVEIECANRDDVQHRGEGMALLVRGKTRDRLVHLRPNISNAIAAYFAVRGAVAPDAHGTPLFTAVGNFVGGERLGRRGIRKTVDGYLRAIRNRRRCQRPADSVDCRQGGHGGRRDGRRIGSMRTDLCVLLGIAQPIIQAAIWPATSPELVAAVSNASGLGETVRVATAGPWDPTAPRLRWRTCATRCSAVAARAHASTRGVAP